MTDLATLYEILDGPMTDKLPPQWALDKVIEVFGEDEYTGTLHAAARLIVAERETRSIELGQLRRRVTAQRRELRRLNKYYMMYWHG